MAKDEGMHLSPAITPIKWQTFAYLVKVCSVQYAGALRMILQLMPQLYARLPHEC